MTVGIGFLDSDSYGTASAISRSRKRTSLLRPGATILHLSEFTRRRAANRSHAGVR